MEVLFLSDIFVSFIIPVYNVEDYLRECVDSIVSQIEDNAEIILVDDGSKDSSGLICDEYKDKYDFVKVIHQQNAGLSEARNAGIQMACGEYVLFVDSDDYIEPGALVSILEYAKKYESDVMFLETQKVFPDGSKAVLGNGITEAGVNGKTKDEALAFLSTCPKYACSAWAKLIKKSIFNNGTMFFQKGLLSEDIDWTFKLTNCADSFSYCPKMYYNYRQSREGSITNSIVPKRVEDLCSIIEKWNNFAGEKTGVEKTFIVSQLAYEYPILLYLYSELSSKERQAYKKRIRSLKHLLKCRGGLKYSITSFLCNVLGIGFASKLIGLYMKFR